MEEPYLNPNILTPQVYGEAALKEWRSPPKAQHNNPPKAGELGNRSFVILCYTLYSDCICTGKGYSVPIKLQKVVEKRYAEHNFNIVVSERIPLIRSLPDMRDAA